MVNKKAMTRTYRTFQYAVLVMTTKNVLYSIPTLKYVIKLLSYLLDFSKSKLKAQNKAVQLFRYTA